MKRCAFLTISAVLTLAGNRPGQDFTRWSVDAPLRALRGRRVSRELRELRKLN
jgi:hypothetical protein